MNDTPATNYVSRAAGKLIAALDAFTLDLTDAICVDFGCNVGGFTQVMLERGAREVHAIDTGYGTLAWKLRNDPRVHVMERTNALHLEPCVQQVDCLAIDLGWTPQDKALPAALRWRPGVILSLIKPHYEASAMGCQPAQGVLDDDQAHHIALQVYDHAARQYDLQPVGLITSPIRGGQRGKGNLEFLAGYTPHPTDPAHRVQRS